MKMSSFKIKGAVPFRKDVIVDLPLTIGTYPILDVETDLPSPFGSESSDPLFSTAGGHQPTSADSVLANPSPPYPEDGRISLLIS